MNDDLSPSQQLEKEKFYQKLQNDPMAHVSLEFVATIIFIIALFLIGIKPTVITIKQIEANLEQLQTFNVSLETKINSLKDLTSIYQTNKQKFDLLAVAIPETTQFPLFEKQLRYLIKQNQLSLLSLTFSKIPLIKDNKEKELTAPSQDNDDDESENSLTFNLAASGSYETIKNFVSQLQNLNRLVTIKNFTISQSSSSVDQLNFTVSGTIYYGF